MHSRRVDPGPPAPHQPGFRPHLRASDADRERVAEVLRAAAGTGHLDLTEADERQAAAYRARTLGDLAPLTADLPVPSPLTAAGRRPWGPAVVPGLGVYLAVSVLLVGIWALTGGGGFWPAWYLGFGLFGWLPRAAGWSGGCGAPRPSGSER